MSNTKISTRAGRKIQIVSKGHVIDIATGIEFETWASYGTRTTWRVKGGRFQWKTLNAALETLTSEGK